MEDFQWEYYDNLDTVDNYNESMTDGSYIEDEEYYDRQDDLRDWENYYSEISDEIEY